jgi:hypothetical protein
VATTGRSASEQRPITLTSLNPDERQIVLALLRAAATHRATRATETRSAAEVDEKSKPFRRSAAELRRASE